MKDTSAQEIAKIFKIENIKETQLLKRAKNYALGKTGEDLSKSIEKSLNGIYKKMIQNFYSYKPKRYIRHFNPSGVNLYRSSPYQIKKRRKNGFAIYSFGDFRPDPKDMAEYRKTDATIAPGEVLNLITGVENGQGWRFYIGDTEKAKTNNMGWNLKTQTIHDTHFGKLSTENATTIKRGFENIENQMNYKIPEVGATLFDKYFTGFLKTEG